MAVNSPTGKILVVDDEALLANLLAEWIREKWTCETITTPSDVISHVDESVDLVLLDRQMPGMSGEAVLAEIHEQIEFPPQVMMVSGVAPDFDIIDLPIDDYLRKPVERPTLQAKIEQLFFRRTYRADVQEYFVCAAKLDVIERVKAAGELAENDQYLELLTRADELRQAADATLGRMSEHVAEFHEMDADD